MFLSAIPPRKDTSLLSTLNKLQCHHHHHQLDRPPKPLLPIYVLLPILTALLFGCLLLSLMKERPDKYAPGEPKTGQIEPSAGQKEPKSNPHN